MFAKLFNQIFDSSIADDFQLRHFFMDMLVLADINGVVDMTPTAIAARTRIPLEDVIPMLAKLEQPDPESRTPDAEGRRIERLDDHRTWGWHILNYNRFRQIASEDQRREKTRTRVANFRLKRLQSEPCNAPVTPANAGNAMQRQRQKQSDKALSTKAKRLTPAQKELADRIEAALDDQWINDAGKWISRIKADPTKTLRVIAEIESAIKENRILTTPAQYAESTWGQFK